MEKLLEEKMLEFEEEALAKIKTLLNEGKTAEEILKSNEFNYEYLYKAGIPITLICPKKEGQNVMEHLEYSIPNEGKFEYFNGSVFGDAYGRDSLLMCLLGNAGLERLVEMLPDESINILKELLEEKYKKI